MIDSSDTSRLATSRSELLTMLSEDELKSVPVLVFANKQDVSGALSPAEISDKLGLAGGEKGREWSVRGSCATKGDGLEEGLDWCVGSMSFLRHCGGTLCTASYRAALQRGIGPGMALTAGWSIQYRNEHEGMVRLHDVTIGYIDPAGRAPCVRRIRTDRDHTLV